MFRPLGTVCGVGLSDRGSGPGDGPWLDCEIRSAGDKNLLLLHFIPICESALLTLLLVEASLLIFDFPFTSFLFFTYSLLHCSICALQACSLFLCFRFLYVLPHRVLFFAGIVSKSQPFAASQFCKCFSLIFTFFFFTLKIKHSQLFICIIVAACAIVDFGIFVLISNELMFYFVNIKLKIPVPLHEINHSIGADEVLSVECQGIVAAYGESRQGKAGCSFGSIGVCPFALEILRQRTEM